MGVTRNHCCTRGPESAAIGTKQSNDEAAGGSGRVCPGDCTCRTDEEENRFLRFACQPAVALMWARRIRFDRARQHGGWPCRGPQGRWGIIERRVTTGEPATHEIVPLWSGQKRSPWRAGSVSDRRAPVAYAPGSPGPKASPAKVSKAGRSRSVAVTAKLVGCKPAGGSSHDRTPVWGYSPPPDRH